MFRVEREGKLMDTSIEVARIIGPLLIVNAVGMLAGGKSYRAMAEEFVRSRALIYLAGFLAMFIGLEVVNAWKPGWPIALTVVGWLFVVGGAIRMLLPDRVMAMGTTMLDKKPELMTISAIVQLLLGLSVLLQSM
jgi:hypothetical protein